MREKIKVVHLTTVHHPFDTRIYHKECVSLANAGFDVTLIAQPPADGVNPNPKVKLIPLEKQSGRIKRMLFSTMEAYRKAKQLQADVYHIHDPELLPVARLLKKKNNIVIYDVHEDYVTSISQKQYLAAPVRKMMAHFYKFVEKLFTKNVEFCLAEKYYKEQYPSGICILNYPMINQNLLAYERDWQAERNQLIYTGNVTLDRGALIHAKLPEWDKHIKVHYIGKCAPAIAEKIRETSNENSDRIVINGVGRYVERDEIDAAYMNNELLAGIALFPPTEHYMKKELTKFFEYMIAGLPVLCSNFPVWKEFIEKYQCGLTVDPYNPDEIHAALKFLKENPEKAKQMAENGKKAVMESLNWEEEEKKLVNWYEQLLAYDSNRARG